MDRTPFDELAASLDIRDWQVLIVGDGSSGSWDSPCGWSLSLFDARLGGMRLHGGCSTGTNNYAELAPYLHALWTLEQWWEREKRSRATRIDIVSDSELTVNCANGRYARRANLGLWASFDHYAREVEVRFHHVRRNSNPLSSLADEVAGQVRKLLSLRPEG